MARPCKLTQEIEDRICLALRAGAFLCTAAEVAGVDPSTLRRWLNDQRPRFKKFQKKVRQAEAEGELLLVGRASQGASNSPAAAIRLLERRYPARYGPHRLNLAGSDPLAVPPEPMTAEAAQDNNVISQLSESWRQFVYEAIATGLIGNVDPAGWIYRATHRSPLLIEDSTWQPAWWSIPGGEPGASGL